MALSIGFGNSVSLLPAIQATRLLTFALVGLSPTEHTCFSWSRFRTVGFPQYGFKAGLSDRAFPFDATLASVGLPLSFVLPATRVGSPFCAGGRCALEHLRSSGPAALPQGPSLQTGFFCPGPSSLTAPSAPLAGTSRFHRLAAYTGCLRCAHCA